MLLNEFLKAHRKIEEQGAMIAQQQKLSAQLETSKLATQTVLNNLQSLQHCKLTLV